MASKSNDDALGAVIFILIVLGICAYFLIKWAIIGIIVLIVLFISWLIKISDKNTIKNIIDTSYSNCKINIPYNRHLSIEELRKILNLDDLDTKNLFLDRIKDRGERYAIQGKVTQLIKSGNTYKSIVDGTKKYDVFIHYNDDGKTIESLNCNCPYHLEDNKNCKHIYATLYLINCKKNPQKIIAGITNYSNSTTKMFSSITKYINDHPNKIEKSSIDKYSMMFKSYEASLIRLLNDIKDTNYSEQQLLLSFQHIVNFTNDIKKFIMDSLNKTNTHVKEGISNYIDEEEEKISNVKTGIAGAIVLDEILNHNKKDKDYDEDLEKEMELHALEEWQKDLVRKGEYFPWNFEEDGELDEDDYYYEDDD